MSFNPFDQKYSTEGTTAEAAHEGGGGVVKIAGMYHVSVSSVEYKETDLEGDKAVLPHYEMKLTILGGEHESEFGKTVYHRLYLAAWEDKANKIPKALEDKHVAGVLTFLHSFGTVGDDVFDNPAVELDQGMFDRLVNTQAIAKVSMSEERFDKVSGKTYASRAEISWNSDVWPVNHEKVADVPKDVSALQYAMTGAVSNEDLDDL